MFSAEQSAVLANLLGNTLHPVGRMTWMKRVVPGQPDDSFLLIKLGSADPPGARMPEGRPHLQQCDLDAIRAWITNGAMDD